MFRRMGRLDVWTSRRLSTGSGGGRGGGKGGLKLVGGNVFGRCARAPVPGGRIGSPGSQARARARKHCHHPIFEAKLASF